MNARQLQDVIIVPALRALGFYSPSALNLMLGTAAQESKLGHYLAQLKGPAIGLYQMEPITYLDIWHRYIQNSPAMRAKIRLMLGYEIMPNAQRMASDLILATIMARLKYLDAPEALPAANDIQGLGLYWKKYYNSALGAGTAEQFVSSFKSMAI